jgi:hypothetical protein
MNKEGEKGSIANGVGEMWLIKATSSNGSRGKAQKTCIIFYRRSLSSFYASTASFRLNDHQKLCPPQNKFNLWLCSTRCNNENDFLSFFLYLTARGKKRFQKTNLRSED